jgi:hypothetical protein
MALTELEQKRIERAVGQFVERHRPPPHIRPQLDLAFRLSGQSVEIFNIRPRSKEPSEKIEQPVAKATFVKSTGKWKVFWMRADLKWHSYAPTPHVRSLEHFLELVEADAHSCFFG